MCIVTLAERETCADKAESEMTVVASRPRWENLQDETYEACVGKFVPHGSKSGEKEFKLQLLSTSPGRYYLALATEDEEVTTDNFRLRFQLFVNGRPCGEPLKHNFKEQHNCGHLVEEDINGGGSSTVTCGVRILRWRPHNPESETDASNAATVSFEFC